MPAEEPNWCRVLSHANLNVTPPCRSPTWTHDHSLTLTVLRRHSAAGFLCTLQSGKKDAHRAVEEAKHILSLSPVDLATPLIRPAAAAAAPAVTDLGLFGASLPLHEVGETGIYGGALVNINIVAARIFVEGGVLINLLRTIYADEH